MKIQPLISEKSLDEAKKGFYTFKVDNAMNKHQIRRTIEQTFKVKVDDVRTMQIKAREKMNIWGRNKKVQAFKKAVVSLKGKDTIDIFESKE